MIKTIFSIFILAAIFWTVVFTGLVPILTSFVSDFNESVVVFLPTEIRVIVLILVFIMLLKLKDIFTN